ncbi:hypothetical protein DACRYDRAFT_103953 [Dacryopinax primogenitus]|uniref:Uncharacterized protein n=1 Tax=Dacryopinax primogenitus (strain DJM 731) TaxID=1858805 RepID=M5GAR4_DACPD|nr:uncharacterized protein DACRYDRAFT_103953 [Dacryopinax primogenitus]EJU05465.1 hypothetical protein DACRYDRAFT_103953 [Dacryopinax primogenitus]
MSRSGQTTIMFSLLPSLLSLCTSLKLLVSEPMYGKYMRLFLLIQAYRTAENLRDDKKYITSFLNAGWTNDMMTIANLLYLVLYTSQ